MEVGHVARSRGMKEWWLPELPYAGREHLDEQYVAGYERKAGFDPAEDLDVLDRHALGPDSTVVDLGAGVGTFAFAVAPRCRKHWTIGSDAVARW